MSNVNPAGKISAGTTEGEEYETVEIDSLTLTDRFQVMNEPDEEESEGLKSQIGSEGQVDVIIVDEDNNVLDGHTRVPIFRDFGFETVRVYRMTDLSDSEKRKVAWGRNMARRHLDEGEKREKTKEYLKQDYEPDEQTQGDVAKTLGVSESTVSRAVKALKRDEDVEKFSAESLSMDEKKNMAREMLREYPDASNNAVAEEVGLSHPTVGNVREDMEEQASEEANTPEKSAQALWERVKDDSDDSAELVQFKKGLRATGTGLKSMDRETIKDARDFFQVFLYHFEVEESIGLMQCPHCGSGPEYINRTCCNSSKGNTHGTATRSMADD